MKNLVTAHEIRRTPAKLGFFGQWIHFRIDIVGCGWGWGGGHTCFSTAWKNCPLRECILIEMDGFRWSLRMYKVIIS